MNIKFPNKPNTAAAFAELMGAGHAAEPDGERIRKIKTEYLIPAREHPFRINEDRLNELRASILENGIEQPLLVRPHPEKEGYFEICAGHHRHRVAVEEHIPECPCLVEEMDDLNFYRKMRETNIQRGMSEIVPSELAKAYALEYRCKQGQRTDLKEGSAEEDGSTTRNVRRYLRLNKLAKELLAQVDTGKIPVNAGVQLSYLDDLRQQQIVEYMRTTRNRRISVPQAEAIRRLPVKNFQAMLPTVFTLRQNKAPQTIDLKRIERYFPDGVDRTEYLIAALEAYGKMNASLPDTMSRSGKEKG